jgi:tRNA (guanine37-N1)-methyltransferase
MVLKCEPVFEAVEALAEGAHVILMSPAGRVFDQRAAETLAKREKLLLICPAYEGVDERVSEALVDEEWSIGDYVLSGGELPALVMIDALARLIPGALNDEESAAQDSFMNGLLDCPHYTRPEDFEGRRVPEVLLSGDHAAIRRWRMQQMLGRTWLRRPDLLEELALSAEQKQLLDSFIREHSED